MSRDIVNRMGEGNWHMPARPRIPDPKEGPLQEFAYDLRELGAGQVSVAWIAGHEETTVSRAALYAALSGTRLPRRETVGTLLRWWVGNPADEDPEATVYSEPSWAWIDRLPAVHEGRQSGIQWRDRYRKLVRKVEGERDFIPKAPRVAIAVPPEQQRLINELKDLISKTGLPDERWLVFGAMTPRVERYLAAEVIPTKEMCWQIAERCDPFTPFEVDFYDVGRRLEMAAELARHARARDRRIARTDRSERG
ncbi:hypothetical protein [Streptomyces sp. NPDC002078]